MYTSSRLCNNRTHLYRLRMGTMPPVPQETNRGAARARKGAVERRAVASDGRYLQGVDRMGGFAKGLSVIEAFGKGRSALTIADAARLSGLDRASARRCLLTLVEAGYASMDGRSFQLTPLILRLGHAYLAVPLPRLIQPSLDRLADDLREACSVTVLDGANIACIARAAYRGDTSLGLGSRLPAYCTSSGRVLLASLPVEQARTVLRSSERQALTEHTLTRIDDLIAELGRARAAGYSIIDQEAEMGARSIAVPINNISGKTVAAITVGVQAARVSVEKLRDEYLPHLLDFKTQLSSFLP